MAITNQDDLIAAMAAGQNVLISRSGARTTVAFIPYQTLDLAGNPGAGVLAGTNTANGVVPTDATAGFPPVNAFAGGASGYIGALDFGANLPCRIWLCDMLFKAGAYAFNANVTLASQPSYASRMPDGDYKGTELWMEAVTAFTNNQSIRIIYTNQDGTTGRDTGIILTGVAPTVGRMYRIPLASGDSGVQKIEQVISSGSTAGTFNVLVIRTLALLRIPIAGFADTYGPDRTELARIFDNSALFCIVAPDSTAMPGWDILFGALNK